MHVIVWEFRPKPGKEREFETAYGPAGDWVRLFRSGPGYLGTELLRALRDPRRYLTVDRWESREVYDSFRATRAADYDALDRRFEGLTESETELGSFSRAGPESSGSI